jgi:hypothetical protein
LDALRRIEEGQTLYGVHCGVVFGDVARPAQSEARLRSVVAAL